MATLNKAVSVPAPRTHEGAIAARITPILELRRTVLTCMLWETTYYESGVSIADRIKGLVPRCAPEAVAMLAIAARTEMKLRHVPLLLARELVRGGANIRTLLATIIQRPDEMTEFLAIYWAGADKDSPLPYNVKQGLGDAFRKFNEYALAKYDRDGEYKLRDVLRLCHPTPKDEAQHALWGRVKARTLVTPDTWETTLSAGDGKKTLEEKQAHWTRLITEGKLGALALLRNLRNMTEAKVDDALIRAALGAAKPDRVLPFRFISAAQHAPRFEPELEALMFSCLATREKLPGHTVLLVDCSGSMYGTPVSAKSEIDRFEAAAAMAMLVREVCQTATVIGFHNSPGLIPARRGFALRDLLKSIGTGGTYTEKAKQVADSIGYDRLVIITDEQSHEKITYPLTGAKGYVINVAPYQHGIGYGAYTHIDGWSEAVLDFIVASEKLEDDTHMEMTIG